MVGKYADRTPYDLCEHVFSRGEGWHCKVVEYSDPSVSNDTLLRAALLLIAALIFLDWCRRVGRRDGEQHGPKL